eukprot:TRINITY_DN23464_c0_g1_i1.p1 TRINITY_DN23464_c0_g1~~TRINITY_DN23464_c0_g1_i1.p1  ORF type:complete len:278 (+),score=51.84 TRINITY_DN23464_c0_g1_i1:57-836(+)
MSKCPIFYEYANTTGWCLVLCKYGVDVVPVANQTDICRGMTNEECEAVTGPGATWWWKCYDAAGPPVSNFTNMTRVNVAQDSYGDEMLAVYIGLAAFVVLYVIVFLSTGKGATRNKKILAACCVLTLLFVFGASFFLSISILAVTSATGVLAVLGIPLAGGVAWAIYSKITKEKRLEKKIKKVSQEEREEAQREQQGDRQDEVEEEPKPPTAAPPPPQLPPNFGYPQYPYPYPGFHPMYPYAPRQEGPPANPLAMYHMG